MKFFSEILNLKFYKSSFFTFGRENDGGGRL
jgi:hypothetical protein